MNKDELKNITKPFNAEANLMKTERVKAGKTARQNNLK